MISKTNYKNGEKSSIYEFTYNYDENSNLLKTTDVNENTTTEFFPNGLKKSENEFTYEYTYDSSGNWIRKLCMKTEKNIRKAQERLLILNEPH